MRLQIISSPSDHVTLTRYTEDEFPLFQQLFEDMTEDSPLRHFAQTPESAATALVVQNQSEKDITALRYRWTFVDAGGSDRTHVASMDSYAVDVYRPVLSPGTRLLVTETESIAETTINHVLAGGGMIMSRGRFPSDHGTNGAQFQIEFVMFADGETAGPDPDHYGEELQLRQRAAVYVAAQIRSAEKENRDITSALSAICDAPRYPDDLQGRLIDEYARRYLRRSMMKMGTTNWKEAALKHLEERPTLPTFYRRDASR
jgi:hypothetical protein